MQIVGQCWLQNNSDEPEAQHQGANPERRRPFHASLRGRPTSLARILSNDDRASASTNVADASMVPGRLPHGAGKFASVVSG
jgi:hypothetical protein